MDIDQDGRSNSVVVQSYLHRWRNLPPNLRGALWLLMSAVLFTGMSTLVKFLGSRYAALEVAFFRSLTGLIFILPFLFRAGGVGFKTQRLRMHLLRGLCGTGGMMCGFYALVHLPLADANAISFSRALFLVPMAFLFVGEVAGWRRGLATIVGFAGVLVVVRPSGTMDPAAAVALLGAALVAGAVICVKLLSRTDGPTTLLFYSSLIGLTITTIPAVLQWTTPTFSDMGLLLLMGLFGVSAHTCFIRAYSIGDVVALAPIDYMRLIFAGTAGYVFFANVPDQFTILGAVIIVLSTLYITLREARIARNSPDEFTMKVAAIGTSDPLQEPVYGPIRTPVAQAQHSAPDPQKPPEKG